MKKLITLVCFAFLIVYAKEDGLGTDTKTTLAPPTEQKFSSINGGFNYGVDKIRGANLGSWLILEKWMTPNVFDGLPSNVVDEFTLCKHLGKVEAKKRLRKHWDTFITEGDIQHLSRTGLNHLRLPIGYWALDHRPRDPYVAGSWHYVHKVVAWAKKYNMQVMIDLHGVPGSQNGFESSGHAGEVKFFYDDENLMRAVKVLEIIAGAFGTPEWKDTVTILQTVNEPHLGSDMDFRLKKLKQYNRMAYDAIRAKNKDIIVAFSDGFIDLPNWYFYGDEPHFSRVMLDTHIYQTFGDQWLSLNCHQHLSQPCTQIGRLSQANAKVWTVVGEWSLATAGNCTNDSPDGRKFGKLFSEQQIGVYENATNGWIFWSAKLALFSLEWSFSIAHNEGLIDLSRNNNQPNCLIS